MTVTKQHYARIAAVFADYTYKGVCPNTAENTRRELARQLAAALRGTNPNYDEARFLKACEVDNE